MNMGSHCWHILLALFGVVVGALATPSPAAEHRVKSGDDVVEAMRVAKPGDELVMADENWRDEEIILSGRGTADKPITLRAATPGKVILDGNSRVLIEGEHLVVSGLSFVDSKGTDTLIEIKGSDNRVTESSIVAPSRGGRFVHFNGGQRNRLDHCYFEGHAPREVTVQVEVEEAHPNEHLIDHNHFGPRPPLGENGGETMRIGY